MKTKELGEKAKKAPGSGIWWPLGTENSVSPVSSEAVSNGLFDDVQSSVDGFQMKRGENGVEGVPLQTLIQSLGETLLRVNYLLQTIPC